MTARVHRPIELVVLHALPDDLTNLLTDGRGDLVHVVQGGRRDGPPAELADLERVWPEGLSHPVLRLPIDGPRHAVEVAVAGLARHGVDAIVAPCMAAGAPPDWWVLDLLVAYGVSPALDLGRVQWHDGAGLWWTTRRGPVRLPVPITRPNESIDAAEILRVADGLREAGPVAGWFASVALTEEAPSAAAWSAALAAQYLDMAVAHLGGEVPS